MSSHRLSVSGERPFTHSGGGGAASSMQYPAKAGDGVNFSLSAASDIIIPLPAGARIEKRVYDREGSRLETFVLVMDRASAEARGFGGSISHSVSVHARCEDDKYPVTHSDVRRSDFDRDPAWLGWGGFEVVGAVEVPRFAMGEQEIAERGGTAPAYVGDASVEAKLNAADALLTNIELATSEAEQQLVAVRAGIDALRAGVRSSGPGEKDGSEE